MIKDEKLNFGQFSISRFTDFYKIGNRSYMKEGPFQGHLDFKILKIDIFIFFFVVIQYITELVT